MISKPEILDLVLSIILSYALCLSAITIRDKKYYYLGLSVFSGVLSVGIWVLLRVIFP